MKVFSKGDLVEVIDENLVGKVAFAKANTIIILTEDGFSMEFPKSSVVHKKDLKINEVQIRNKSLESPRVVKKVNGKNSDRELVVDLHIHEIVANDQYLTSFEKLQFQIDEAKAKLAQARSKKISKIVFIHGVGKGVLRKELYKFLDGCMGIEFYDADYASYGRGATEVKIYRFDV